MLLTLLADSLRQSPNLRVLQTAEWPEVEAHAAGAAQDVLIYELEDSSIWHILPFLFRNPAILLIGLDTETNRALLISGRETHSLTMNQIRTIVEGGEPAPTNSELKKPVV